MHSFLHIYNSCWKSESNTTMVMLLYHYFKTMLADPKGLYLYVCIKIVLNNFCMVSLPQIFKMKFARWK